MKTPSCAVIFDRFSGPMASGLGRLTTAIANAIGRSYDVVTLCSDGASQRAAQTSWVIANRVREAVAHMDPDLVVYVPQPGSSLPLFSKANTLSRTAPLAAHFMVLPSALRRTRLQATLRWLYTGRILVSSFRSLLALSKLSLDAQLMPMGADLDHFRPPRPEEVSSIRKAHGIARDAVVFFLSHPGPWWQETARTLAVTDPSVIVLVPGPGDDNGQLGDRVRILDPRVVDRERYWLADCLVSEEPANQPDFETPPAVIEALACGVPVLSTRENSWRDFLREGSDVRFFSGTAEFRRHAESFLTGERARVRPVSGFAWADLVGGFVNCVDRVPPPFAHGGNGSAARGARSAVAGD